MPPLTLLAFCALRTHYPHGWHKYLAAVGLGERWQEDYVGSKAHTSYERRKLQRCVPKMFQCAEGHWTPYELTADVRYIELCRAGAVVHRLWGAKHQRCPRHLKTDRIVEVRAPFSDGTKRTAVLFEARVDELCAITPQPSGSIEFTWHFKEPRRIRLGAWEKYDVNGVDVRIDKNLSVSYSYLSAST